MNYLIDLMNQLDLEFSSTRIYDFINPHSTKCMTWQDVKASHETDNPEVIIRLDDIFGMVIFLAIGLGGAVVVLILEIVMKARKKRSMKNNLAADGNYILIQFFYKCRCFLCSRCERRS